MLGVVRHDNGVRVPSPIRGKRLAVFRWIFGPSREAFSEDVPHKKCSFCGNPGGGPPNTDITRNSETKGHFSTQNNWRERNGWTNSLTFPSLCCFTFCGFQANLRVALFLSQHKKGLGGCFVHRFGSEG